MKKQELVDQSKIKRKELDFLITKIKENNDLSTLVANKWKVTDVLAHIFWHEKEMISLIENMSMEGSPYWLLPTHERNEKIFQDYKNTSLGEIVDEYNNSFQPMIKLLANLPENAMTDSSLFASMPSDWEPWIVFAGNMNKHYEDHISQLQKRFDYL